MCNYPLFRPLHTSNSLGLTKINTRNDNVCETLMLKKALKLKYGYMESVSVKLRGALLQNSRFLLRYARAIHAYF